MHLSNRRKSTLGSPLRENCTAGFAWGFGHKGEIPRPNSTSRNISRDLTNDIIDKCRTRRLRKNIILLLTTHGGDPNAAYIISRCFQQAYKTRKAGFENENSDRGEFSIVIDGLCKSAGTLLCLGADELIMSGNGELGPLDIQLLKEDEISERTSGLTPIQAVKFLEGEAERMFRRTFTSLKLSGMNFSTKMAAQISTDITLRTSQNLKFDEA